MQFTISPKILGIVNYNCVVNVARGVLLVFYIFRSEKLKHDYIKLCKLSTCMAMKKKKMITQMAIQKKTSCPLRLAKGREKLTHFD
jgi:hypothetical protein